MLILYVSIDESAAVDVESISQFNVDLKIFFGWNVSVDSTALM